MAELVYLLQAAYDHLRKAKKLAQERIDKLDSKRKKVKLGKHIKENLF